MERTGRTDREMEIDPADGGPMPEGWDDWLRWAVLTPEESAAVLDRLLSMPLRDAHPVLDRIGRQVAFATRSLRPFAERHRVYTEPWHGGW